MKEAFFARPVICSIRSDQSEITKVFTPATTGAANHKKKDGGQFFSIDLMVLGSVLTVYIEEYMI